MKIVFIIIFYYLSIIKLNAQDVINPYLEYQGQPSSSLNIINSNSYYYLEESPALNYAGEYEILLDQSNPWGNQYCGNSNAPFDYGNFALSYQIELVSFPFSMDCAFPSTSDPDGGCSQPPDRILNVPDDGLMNTTIDKWVYPYVNSFIEYTLWRITPLKKFDRHQFHQFAYSDQHNENSLVSASFVKATGAGSPHSVLPHSILKHTVNIHCGNDITDPIISSFSWYSDLTRGRMREYPFHYGLITSANLKAWDIITRPEFYAFGVYSQTDNSNCNFYRSAIGLSCNSDPDVEGFTINYTPFNPAQDDQCQFIPAAPNTNNADYNNWSCYHEGLFCIPLQDYTVIASSSPKNYNGTTLAGYELVPLPGGTLSLIDPNPPIFHKYYIDKNIDLDWINHSEMTIYNPSEVYITATDLKFPSNYTFKTIRGVYPYASEVTADEVDLANGGPFSDPTKRDVPIQTDLFKDFHVSQQYDPNNQDHRYSSIYHLLSGSKLTVKPCVKIFDATFEINPGSEIVFENWSTNQINVNRYQLLYSGGKITKRNYSFLFQNNNETKRILNWEGGDFIAAGANVDVNSTSGEYSLEVNSSVSFEATNYIDLKPGFNAKYGSEFEALIRPINVPSCPPFRLKSPFNSKINNSFNSAGIGYFTVSPNPTLDNSFFMFEVYEKSNARISIYDSMGNLIREIGENSILPAGKYIYNFHTSNLASGLYIAKLQTGNFQKSIKFIKQ